MLIFLFIIPKEATAQPAYCVDPTSSWGQSYRVGSVQSVLYYKDLQLFSATMTPGKIDNLHIHTKVPLNTASRFQSLTDATQAYNSSIANKFSQIILAQTGCPILAENGNYILNGGGGPGPTKFNVLSTGNSGLCLATGGPTITLLRDWSTDFSSDFGPVIPVSGSDQYCLAIGSP